MHYRKRGLFHEIVASLRAKDPTHNRRALCRESRSRSQRRMGPRHKVPLPRAWGLKLSAKGRPTVQIVFAKSQRPQALGEESSWRRTNDIITAVAQPSILPRATPPRLSAKRLPIARGAPLPIASTLWWVHAPYSQQNFQKNFTFSTSNFFLAQHTLIQCTCSNLVPFCLCLLYLTILLRST
jgi:hypothetical protein